MNNELKQNIKDHETQMNIIALQKLQLHVFDPSFEGRLECDYNIILHMM